MRLIAGAFKNRRLARPPADCTRPTMDRTRESVFNILTHQANFADASVLDVFAGSGAYGLEALSRGAKQAFFVENNPRVIPTLKENISSLGVEHQSVIMRENSIYLSQAPHSVDFIFLDPPYDQPDLIEPTLERLLFQGWVSFDTLVTLEVEAKNGSIKDVLSHRWRVHLCRPYGRSLIFLGSMPRT